MTSPIITEAVRALVDRRDLTRIEAAAAMDAIMSGAATNAQIAAFLTALSMKGETVEELIGFAQVMRQKVVRVPTRGGEVEGLSGTDREMLIDTCGTGGDASGSFNVSTATAFVVAGAGLKVAKHGNRSASSLCGSADVVETLGISLELTPAQVGRCIDEVGIGFLYAPLLHTAMKHVMAARRELGFRTVFNLLGPLTNPAGANAQIIGVARASCGPSRCGPRTSGSRARPSGTSAVGTASRTRRSSEQSSTASGGRAGTSSCSTPRRPSSQERRRAISRTASSWPRARSMAARPARGSIVWSL